MLKPSENFFDEKIVNKEIIRPTINFLKPSERFVQPLFRQTAFVLIFSICLFFLPTHLL